MKSLKLLTISFIVTFVTLLTISPALAEPLIKVQHLKVSDHLAAKINDYNIINMPSSLSTSLIFSQSTSLTEEESPLAIEVASQSHDFFTSAMVFNDKLHQLISYFSNPETKSISKPATLTPQGDELKKKCNSTLSFS